MMQGNIRAAKLAKHYGTKPVIEGIDLNLGPGVHVLLGANGAGKSTLLRILAGLELPDAGTVTLCGLDHASRVERMRHLGVLPDGLGLFEVLSIEENLLACGSVYGLASAEVSSRAQDLLGLLDLWPVRHTAAREGSFGMRKKTALAMALLHVPSVLLLDEPFEGIDPNSTLALRALLRSVAKAGAAILLTSHLLAQMEALADTVLLLHQGKLALHQPMASLTAGLEQTYLTIVGETARETPSWLLS